MPLDLRSFVRTADRSWIERHERRLSEAGKINLTDMICAMGRALDEVPEGKYYDIERNVKPENHEVFVKVACDYMDTVYDYRFNRLMNRVYHDYPTIFTNEKRRQAVERTGGKQPE
ncbi:MAG TPA: hypothetical protein VK152_06770 [Paludibacter sp.]|nr:hypothetical protein [Paludibacter sp.]